jgi:hypothetical protein
MVMDTDTVDNDTETDTDRGTLLGQLAKIQER